MSKPALPTIALDALDAVHGGMRYTSADRESVNVEDRRPGATPSTTARPSSPSDIDPSIKLPPQQPLPLPTWPPPSR